MPIIRLKKIVFIFVLLLLFHSLVTAGTLQGRPFILQCGPAKDTPVAQWMGLVYGEIFRRLNHPLEIYYLPSLRSSMMADVGQVDGQMYRVFEYQALYQNQLRVEEAVVNLPIAAFVRSGDNDLRITDWNSLVQRDLAVEYVRGVMMTERRLEGLIQKDRLTEVAYSVDGLTNLRYKNSDVFVHSLIDAYPYLQEKPYRDQITAAAVLERVALFPYVHRKHWWLAPKIEDALAQVKQEGLLLQYCRQAFGEDLQSLCEIAQPDD